VSQLLRETSQYRASQTKRGVRLVAKDKNSTPRRLVVSEKTWQELRSYSDREFDGACVLELGVGTWRRNT